MFLKLLLRSSLIILFFVSYGYAQVTTPPKEENPKTEEKEKEKEAIGSITQDMIKKWTEQKDITPYQQRIRDIVSTHGIREVSINQNFINKHNPFFTHEIKSASITDQQNSGRCWLFAGLNVIRQPLLKKFSLDDFEFSQTYLFFWDKLEKANLFLELMIQRRNIDIRDRKIQDFIANPISDGGWWGYFTMLVKKYGVVPKHAMPETISSQNTYFMDKIITERLRAYTIELRKMAKENSNEDALRNKKNEFLGEIYSMLVVHLGLPPTKFEYRYKSKKDDETKLKEVMKIMTDVSTKGNNQDFLSSDAIKELTKDKVSLVKSYSPQEFAKEYVVKELNDYIVLGNIPSRDFNKLYRLEHSRNLYEKPDTSFINITLEDMKIATLQSILSDEPVWFAADIGNQIERDSGILHPDVLLLDDVYNLKPMTINKAERITLGSVSPNHAMVFMGVDYVDDKIVKWLVENSWGEKSGKKGFFHMYDQWFDENVLIVIVNKKYLPERITNILKTDAVIIKEDEPFGKIFIPK